MPTISSVDQATFQQLLASDPEIQAVIRSVWGDTPVNQRPSDTPKNLEKANHDASVKIGQILKAKGVQLPAHTFINPRSGSLEGEHGWAGLPTGVKIAIIGGAALATGGALGAFGGLGAAGGAGGAGGASAGGASGASGLAGLSATAGLPAGIGTSVGTGFGTAGALAGGAAGAGTLASTSLAGSAPLAGGAAAGTAGNLAGGAAGLAGAAKTGSLGGRLISSLVKPSSLETIGKGLGAVAQTQASNRGTALDAMMAGDRMKMEAAANQRSEDSHLWSMLRAANYVKNGGAQGGPEKSASGWDLPTFSFAPKPSSDQDKALAGTMIDQLTNRLNNPLTTSDYESKMNPGKAESALNWAAPLLSGAGSYLSPNTQPKAPVQQPIKYPTTGRG